MRPGRRALAIAVLVCLVSAGANAQTPSDLVSLGVRAYQSLDYDAAATLLRRGLGRTAGDSLTERERLDALTYLAATELFRGRRDAAVGAFEEVVWRDPAYRPNELIFPPQVTTLFREVRETTKAVAVTVAPMTELHVGTGRFTARIRASSPHDLTVAITRVDGTPVRVVYAGPVVDTLEVAWDGHTTAGALPNDGQYVLRVTSAAGPDRGAHAVLVPLEITRVPGDTSSAPAARSPTAPLAPHAPPAPHPGAPLRSLATGLIGAVAVIALPAIVGRGTDATWARFPVAAAIGGSGVVGFLRRPRERPAAAIAPPLPITRPEILIIHAGPATVFAPPSAEAR